MATIWTPDAPNPHAPTTAQVRRATRAEQRWMQQAIPTVGRNDHDMDAVRARTHGICHSYATTSTLIAATLVGECRPDTTTATTRSGTGTSTSGPARPTEATAITRIDRIDRAMHTWAHCYAPCRLCPAPDRPHDEPNSLDTWVTTTDGLVDDVAARTIIATSRDPRVPGILTYIQRLNTAQQDAAMALLDRWDHWWRTGVEPDVLRDVTRRASALTDRIHRVAHQIGARTINTTDQQEAS